MMNERGNGFTAFLKNQRGFTSLKLALGFSVCAIAAALFLTPLVDSNDQTFAYFSDGFQDPGFDNITTGSVKKRDNIKRYTIRRSVLQKDPEAPCIIYESGLREGDC